MSGVRRIDDRSTGLQALNDQTMTEFKNAILRAAGLLLIAAIGLFLPSVAMTETTVVRDVRTGSDNDFVRLVLETDRSLSPPPAVSITGNTLRIALTGSVKVPPDLLSKAYGRDIISLGTQQTPGATRIEAILSFTPADVKTFALSSPHRFVIDAYRPPTSATGASSEEELHSVALIDTPARRPSPSAAGESGAALKRPSETAKDAGSRSRQAAADGSNRNRFQQRLLAILIVVTSILLVAIIFVMCMDRYRR